MMQSLRRPWSFPWQSRLLPTWKSTLRTTIICSIQPFQPWPGTSFSWAERRVGAFSNRRCGRQISGESSGSGRLAKVRCALVPPRRHTPARVADHRQGCRYIPANVAARRSSATPHPFTPHACPRHKRVIHPAAMPWPHRPIARWVKRIIVFKNST